jgi:transposase InsO family protein
MRRRAKRRLPNRNPLPLTVPSSVNGCWSMDFMSDVLQHGHRFRTFNVMDDYNREVLGIDIKGMRQLNGVFTQASNRRHQRSGHLFQGRYKAILVDADTYLMELIRYVVLNPVRAGMVDQPGKWPWLAINKLLAQFAGKRNEAVHGYSQQLHIIQLL